MMDDMLFDFLAYEFFVDGLTEPTEIACPACGESLVYIVDREIYFCQACKTAYTDDTKD